MSEREPQATLGPGVPPPGGEPVTLPLRTGRLIRTVAVGCISVEVLLVLLDYHVNYGGITRFGTLRRLANITREDSLASWFGSTQTLLVALTVWLILAVVRRQAATPRRRVGWLVLALFFSLMALDDGAMLHERAGTLFGDLHSDEASGGPATETGARLLDLFPSYPWQIVALPFFIVLGGFTLVFLWRELRGARSRLLVPVALGCFALAVGLDFIEGLDSDHPWNVYTRTTRAFDFEDWTQYRFGHDPYDTLRHFSKSVEEFLEMVGNTLLWCVFLRRLADTAPELRVRLDDRGGGVRS